MSGRTVTGPRHDVGSGDRAVSHLVRVRAHVGAICLYLSFFAVYFAPTILTGRLLAPGDGVVSYFPALYREWSLWSPNIYSGYPAISDLQFLSWYPLRYIAPSYNMLVMSAYVIAGFLTFCFAYHKLRAFWPAAIAGIVYASAGFMTAHLGHLTIIHSAAWAPLLLLAIDHIAERFTARWFAAGAVGVTLSFLGGHPQIFAYGLALAGTFAVYRIGQTAYSSGWRDGFRLAIACVGMVAAGLAAAAIQVLPSLEFQNLSNRAAGWSYADFISYSLPLHQLPMAVFPYLYGGDSVHFPGYFGEWNLTELTIYSGAGTLLLVAVALAAKQGRPDAIFWLLIAIGAVLMALAPSTPLGKIIFHLPVLGDFRAPARAGFVLNFAIAMLAGAGVARVMTGDVSSKRVWMAIAAVAAGFILTLIFTTQIFKEQAESYRSADLAWVFISVTGMQLALVVVIAIILAAFRRMHSTRIVQAILAITVAADLAAFGQFYEWKLGPEKTVLQMQPDYVALRDEIKASDGRLLPLFPPVSPLSPLSPNLNDYFAIPSAGGYGPLGMADYSAVMNLSPASDLAVPPPENILVAAGISHIAYVKGPVTERTLGSCTPRSDDQIISAQLPTPMLASAVRLASNTGCSVNLLNGVPILQVSVGGSGATQTVEAQVGRDTAEWAYDRSDVVGVVKHARPQIQSSFDIGGGEVGHVYISDLPLPQPVLVGAVTLRLPADAPASLSIRSLHLVGPSGEVAMVPLEAFRSDAIRSTAQPLVTTDGIEVVRYEKSAGLAWLVGRTVTASANDAVSMLRSGLTVDGERFDARTTAIVSDGTLTLSDETVRGSVSVDRRTADNWAINVASEKPALLVISQAWHPGWRAYVDGKKVPILRTNAAFQGVPVPAGASEVRLAFEPRSFIVGSLISATTLVGLALLMALPHISAWRRRRVAPRSATHSDN